MKDYCDVCKIQKSVGVYCSQYTPASFSACNICVRKGAEPLWLLNLAKEIRQEENKSFNDLNETITCIPKKGYVFFGDA